MHCRYGADDSESAFNNASMGGMAADPCIFIQSSVNISHIEQRSRGRWRIHSKLGNGYSTRSALSPALPPPHPHVVLSLVPPARSRQVGEIRSNGYACFPVLDSGGSPVVNAGAGQAVPVASVTSLISLFLNFFIFLFALHRVRFGHALLRCRRRFAAQSRGCDCCSSARHYRAADE